MRNKSIDELGYAAYGNARRSQYGLTAPIRVMAQINNNADFLHMLAGQAASFATAEY